MEPITLKQNDHPSYPQEEVKIIMQDANQNTGETNRGQQQYIKDLGTDFLKELFEKMGQGKNNQAQNQNPNIGQIQTMNNPQNQIIMNTPSQGNMNNMGTFNGLSHMNNMGNFIQLPNNQTAFISGPGPMQSGFFNPTPGNIINTQAMINNQQNTINVSQIPSNQQRAMVANNHNIPQLPINIPAITNTFIIPQPGMNMFGNEIAHQNTINQLGLNIQENISGINQKRGFAMVEKDQAPDLELKNEQVSDVSVKRFRSGEDILWDFDYDKSKRDLEDFIFRTHNAIKNNSYVDNKNSKLPYNFP